MKLIRIETGADLKAFREALHLTIPEMAAAFGKNTRTYEGWEQGRKDRTGLNIYLIQPGFEIPQVAPEASSKKSKYKKATK